MKFLILVFMLLSLFGCERGELPTGSVVVDEIRIKKKVCHYKVSFNKVPTVR